MDIIKLQVSEVEEAISLEVLDELLWHVLFPKYGGNAEFCDGMVVACCNKIQEFMGFVSKNPDAKPNWATSIVMEFEPPKQAKVSSCYWRTEVNV